MDGNDRNCETEAQLIEVTIDFKIVIYLIFAGNHHIN